ncbi:MAG: toll/interleukin-1 receptor domain-containing protein [Bacteroidaceae bacterium]|nr:toll/interleukin-1 receptor domain-containing protein [Bacteroidaceae bacterium]
MNQELKGYYTTVAELLREEKHMEAHRIFTGGDVASYVVAHDDWDGGMDFYSVEITIDVKTFVDLRKRGIVEEVCGQITEAFNVCMNNIPDSVRGVSLTPSSTATFDERKIAEPSSYWKVGYYKVFISHVSKYKESASNLKLMLEPYGISAFVAHEDIKPSKEWEVEIEKALFSMNALCAILTPDFSESSWCDQECGYAFGRNVLTIPIEKGQLPYGMFGKIQAIKSEGKNAQQIAESVFDAIVDNDKSRADYIHTLMNLILNNKNEGLINQWIAVLLRIGSIERADLEYLNSHISDVVILMSKENLDAINGLFRTYNLSEVGMKPVEVGTEVADDDLPF